MHIQALPTELRPRELLERQGASALSDAQLLALILRTGVRGKPVLALAQELLDRWGGLAGLLNAPALALREQPGLGPAKCSELQAVMELARRAYSAPMKQGLDLSLLQVVKDYVQIQLGHKGHEVFAVLFLDARMRLMAFEELFRGTLGESKVYPREVVVQALAHRASAVVLAHNHPSGVLDPSAADRLLTQTLIAALALIDVRVLDHIIVSAHGSLSMAECGALS